MPKEHGPDASTWGYGGSAESQQIRHNLPTLARAQRVLSTRRGPSQRAHRRSRPGVRTEPHRPRVSWRVSWQERTLLTAVLPPGSQRLWAVDPAYLWAWATPTLLLMDESDYMGAVTCARCSPYDYKKYFALRKLRSRGLYVVVSFNRRPECRLGTRRQSPCGRGHALNAPARSAFHAWGRSSHVDLLRPIPRRQAPVLP